MSDLDDFFKDPENGDEATMIKFKPSKKIFDLGYKFLKKIKKGTKKKSSRILNNEANQLVGWFKDNKRNLTADIAAEFIVRVFYDNPSHVCTIAIKNELITQMVWDPKNPVISLQRGFVVTLKPNNLWPIKLVHPEGWGYSRDYFIDWLSWMIKDMTDQLTILTKSSLPGVIISKTSKTITAQKNLILAVIIADILIKDLASSYPPSWERLKIKEVTQSKNRINHQRLSAWDRFTNLSDFLRKAVGLPSGSSGLIYMDKASRYGLVEDHFENDDGKNIVRRNVLNCVDCIKTKGEFNEMVWPTQVCSDCNKSGAAFISQRIWLDDAGRFKVPAQVCHACGNPPIKKKSTVRVKAKKKSTVRSEPSYLFVQERIFEGEMIQVTNDSSLPYCNGGTKRHKFPNTPGLGRDTTVYVKYKEAEKVLLQMLQANTTQYDMEIFFGNDDNNNRLIKEICLSNKAAKIPKNFESVIYALKLIIESDNLISLYKKCPKLENLDDFKLAMHVFFEMTLKNDQYKLLLEKKLLNKITTINLQDFNELKTKMIFLFEAFEVNNESATSDKKVANEDFAKKKKEDSD